MPYYGSGKGDYYRGDYYRGDPGFFSFLGGLARSAVGAIPVVGPALSKIIPAGGAAATAGMAARMGAGVRTAGAMIAKHPVLSAAGAAGVAAMGAGVATHALAPGVATKGFHVSRKTGKVVRNRHMRVTNPKALRRSLRRVSGFARMARRVLHFTHPRAARGAPRFKFPKRRKAA